ncbi:PAS domain-containing protein [Shewanella avicenniae]|uniref:histidine kinase n=1 Tax=Shewanella avicenniae TaxID=2814294 RepID=A0ABX7QMP8_9GAMM|nr:ATP-binding protein [Shewanella avicenniae]QSX32727.1 PAS domain-containing protein [Shewanella avicenniae]
MATQSLAKLETISHRGHQWVQMSEAANMSNRMEHILQAMPSGIVILNEDGLVSEANPVAESLLGLPLVGQRWLTIINRSFAPQKDDGHEVSLRNGRRVKLQITPLGQGNGQLIVITDLTETRLLQQNLAHLQRLSALGRMVANLAHQIRTPLSAALLYASNLGNPRLKADARGKFQDKLIDRLGELERQVNDMLLIAKGKQDQQGEEVAVSDLLQLVFANCEPICSKQKATLTLGDSVDAAILANIHGLSSAINNLVLNSLEAGANEICVTSRCEQQQVIITVTDNGKGMDAELQAKVLEPFFTTKAHGTGLGLAVVHSVVKSHGGELSIHCVPRNGCAISLSLPLISRSNVAPVGVCS